MIFLKSSVFKMQSHIILIPVHFSWFSWKFALGSYWNCIHCRLSVVSLCYISSPSFLFLLSSFFLLSLHCLLDKAISCIWTEARADMQILCISGWVVFLTKYKTTHYLSQDAHKASTCNRTLQIMKFKIVFPSRMKISLLWTQEEL